ncbi:bifunctional UDP-sugar hydrolase/5'-nucleotidase UshA [Algibacillus agarilyticus]|uniref:bifunctional UDP-sugar hydrolase/5'-nucleotidase UshA n=1 Tax=Algibacillus agarilyticus TaxID=2234133 RepID=UPI000DCF6550|nr:bifunctional UDP-sugar hydrolase/5'-nucleotidase UshA [Algibacillus agarilyticus]
MRFLYLCVSLFFCLSVNSGCTSSSSLLLPINKTPINKAPINKAHLNTNTSRKITILHTNDHHGRFWVNSDNEYGMAARQTLLNQLRQQAQTQGSTVLLLSGGDINTGVPESDLLKAEPDFKAMSLLGYDAMALGNHEFDNPRAILNKQQQWAHFPLLSANIIDTKSQKPAFQPYALFNKKGLNIAVIGLTTPDTAKIANPKYIADLQFIDPALALKNTVKQIKATQHLDLTIAVTHMGHYADAKHNTNAPGDVTLARNLPAGMLNLIIGGHSQEPVCMKKSVKNRPVDFKAGQACWPDQQNGTWIMQAHEWGKYVGKAELIIEQGKVKLLSYELIPVNLKHRDNNNQATTWVTPYITPDKHLTQFLYPYFEQASEQLKQPIAQIMGTFVGDRNAVRTQQTNLGQLILSAQMQAVNADVGIISSGGIRHSIASGQVLYRDILKVHPFKNRISYIDFSGQALLDYLNHVVKFSPDSGAYPQLRGCDFTLKNGNISQLLINGSPLTLHKSYRLSINSYNAVGGDGYPKLQDHPHYTETQKIDANVLKEYMAQQNQVIQASQYSPQKNQL